jgi:VIT1/CCC1 family predicted Fe2+/Mn2+ transporter
MLIGVSGCNLAWGIVDGVMYIFAAIFERGLRVRLIRDIQNSPTEDAALEHVAREFDKRLESLTTHEERLRIYRNVIELARRTSTTDASIQYHDVCGGLAVTLMIIVATAPVVLPFAVLSNGVIAIRLASGIALVLLFLLGCWWGHMVGVSAIRIGLGLSVLGVLLVLITIALGG